MIDLARPWMLPVALLVGVGTWWLGGGMALALSLAGTSDPSGPGGSRWRAGIPALLRAGAALCLATVLAGPYRVVQVPRDSGRGVAVMVALDVSESMGDATVGGPSKLAAAVREAERFASRRQGDALGLVAFGRDAVVRVPPTVDRGAFLTALRSLGAGDLGDGTAIGTAVGLAANRLRAMDAKAKVILLVTDGKSNAGALDPVTAARAAATLGQHVYVVEVEDGGRGTPLLSRLAAEGGGRHFAASDQAGLETAYREIDRMEPSTFRGIPHTARMPAVAGLLWAALGLMVVARSSRGSTWLGRLP